MYNQKYMASLSKKDRKNIFMSKNKKIGILIGALIFTWIIFSLIANLISWKAVFLDNNEVYFGKGINMPFGSMLTLRNVYLLRVNLSATSSSPLVTSIVEQIQAPRDIISINKSHILYIQDLTTGSPLVKTLEEDLGKR